MKQTSDWNQRRGQLDRDGYAVTADVLTPTQCDRIIEALSVVEPDASRRRGGVRNILQLVGQIRRLVLEGPVRDMVEQVLCPSAFAVRGILFDKTPESNWNIRWHRDTTIAVSHRVDELEGYGPWSTKAGVTHVRPPVSVLEQMLTLRLHLDACDEDNGALRVIPGSHRAGMDEGKPSEPEARVYPAPRGGVLLMRPLLWHRSTKAVAPHHRRIVHIEFADKPLPIPLQWHDPLKALQAGPSDG